MHIRKLVFLIYGMLARWTTAGVAKLGQRRWDEVPVLNGSQVRILPPAPLIQRGRMRTEQNL